MNKIINAIGLLLVLGAGTGEVRADAPMPWLDAKRPPDERARLAVAAMSLDEKLSLLHGPMPLPFLKSAPVPSEAIAGAGYVPGVPRLKIPALFETDASLGVTNPGGSRPQDVATAMPAGLALASTFDPSLAYRAGALIGREAHAKGFNVLLGGGVNLARDPRNGRNFEYLGEDPYLAGVLAGQAIRGTQDQHVVSTVKHFALNDNETNRRSLDAQIDRNALRESDLLAFELAIETGHPGSVMCSYNLLNGTHACANSWLLDEVLKRDWKYPGWVMSDWGAVYGAEDAVHGLDQQSGEQIDKEVWFGEPLKRAVADGHIPLSRIDDMARRILRSRFAVGTIEDPPRKVTIDYGLGDGEALEVARRGVVLLKNDGVLPLAKNLGRIAVIGGQSQFGVLSGAGSSQVTPSNGEVLKIPVGGEGIMGAFRTQYFFPSSPLKQLTARLPNAKVHFDSGYFPGEAAALASRVDVAIVFVTRHELEGFDIPSLTLPQGQDELIRAVAKANPNTVVVLETGNPVAMPWLSSVKAVLAAWYPGQEGGRAIAEILSGEVNPSGRLPITFPVDVAQIIRPALPNLMADPEANVSLRYEEGADVGYRWYQRHGVKPAFAFGHGLSYTSFAYSNLKVMGGKTLTLSFDVSNTGDRDGADVPQAYLTRAGDESTYRLIGFERVELKHGDRTHVVLKADPRLLGHFDEKERHWTVTAGTYQVELAHEAGDGSLQASATIKGSTLAL